ncbi:MAG: hypothetical protein AM1032_000145 [Mycoplasmataceae bacterium]|nr:MAG: hypothetical protein AM1032_000145 [Mycoplasmataceae bacterium]
MINNKEWDKDIIELMEDPNYEVSYNLTPDSTELEKMKYQVCQDILKIQMENNLDEKDIAKTLNISVEKVEEILLCQIYKFNLDQLITYLELLSKYLNLKLFTNYSNTLVSNYQQYSFNNNGYYASEPSNKPNYKL